MSARMLADLRALHLSAVQLFVHRRFMAGTQRSDAYKLGFEASLTYIAIREMGNKIPPYRIGTAEADAWWAGNDAARNQTVIDALMAFIDVIELERTKAARPVQ